MNLFTSDFHFGHSNCVFMDHRPFADADEMDAYIIRMWNERVQGSDDVWFLGDFSHRAKKPASEYLRKLRGHKHLIIGNHDGKMLSDPEAMRYWETADHIKTLNDGKYGKIVLCHFPIADWEGMYRGSWHLFGHIHSTRNASARYMDGMEKAINVGCMLNGYAPCSMRELIENREARRSREARGAAPHAENRLSIR